MHRICCPLKRKVLTNYLVSKIVQHVQYLQSTFQKVSPHWDSSPCLVCDRIYLYQAGKCNSMKELRATPGRSPGELLRCSPSHTL